MNDGFMNSNLDMSLRGAARQSNLLKTCTYDLRDCFATLAMTDSTDFLRFRYA